MIRLRVTELTSTWERTKGLIGKDQPEAVYFHTRWGIHTFFMRFPIDVIILDDHDRVVTMVESLLPFRIFLWNPKHQRVIELPIGTITKEKLQKGQRIQLVSYHKT